MLQALSLIAVLMLVANASLTYAQEEEDDANNEYLPPLRQHVDGLTVDAIQCNAPMELYLRDSQTPVCITPSAFEALIERNINLILHKSYAHTIYTIVDTRESVVQRTVDETLNMYNSDKDNAFANINDISANLISHYPFVLDPTTKKVVAHGENPNRVGVSSLILGSYADKPADQIMEKLQSDGEVWVDYVFIDPLTGEDGLKRSWLVLHDGYIFGSGFYYSAEEKLVNVIDNAIKLYQEDGTFDRINAQQVEPNSHYPFVIDPVTNNSPAHGAFPDISESAIDTDITFQDIADSIQDDDDNGIVHWYIPFKNPTNDKVNLKHVIFKLYDDYLFGAGYYYSGDEKVKSIVENTIEMYKSDRASLVIDINSQSSDLITPHYPFIIDPHTKTIVANGGFPEVVGSTSLLFGDHANKTPNEIIAELYADKGVWVEYVYNVPGTDFEEIKRSYLKLSDGYIFGSGYYFSSFTVVPNR